MRLAARTRFALGAVSFLAGVILMGVGCGYESPSDSKSTNPAGSSPIGERPEEASPGGGPIDGPTGETTDPGPCATVSCTGSEQCVEGSCVPAEKVDLARRLGEYGCEGGDRFLVERAAGEIHKKQIPCAGGCTDGYCRGNSCDNPIVVDGQGATHRGELGSFTPRFDFGTMGESCRVDGVAANSSGSEVLFRVEGVEKGQTIAVDTGADAHDNLVYFSRRCPGAAADFRCAKTGGDRARFTAPESGDWWVVVDKFSRASGQFEYEITVE